MGIRSYMARGRRLWRIDEWIDLPDGTRTRYREREIATKDQAKLLLQQKIGEAQSGALVRTRREYVLTVKDIWDSYEPICR